MTLIAQAVFIGMALGLLAGALGIGGGILAIPVLVYLLGQDPHAATAESLVIIIVTALAALPARFKRKQVRLQIGLVFGVCSALGAVLGTYLNLLASGDLVMLLFSALLIGVAVLMTRNGIKAREAENLALQEANGTATGSMPPAVEELTLSWRRLPLMLVLGTGTGILVSFFGIGGGFAMIPVLVLIMHFDMRVAAGTSFIVIIAVSAISLLSRIGQPVQIDWTVALLFAIGSGIGSSIGSPLSNKARASTLTFIFVALLISVSAYIFGVTVWA